ncbi:hypothetical protein HF521_007877 [Silurus meridionalis]|uniref:Uncharacterized protein n=1 Tax=Silurus meridionalis TaxID=175797 RepID=A0A8T0ARF3_SILME|nr:hypothetical protein HF521_007877 [Silurus meridionalis]
MGNHTTSREGNLTQEQSSRSLPCAFQLTKDSDSYCPRAMGGLQLADAAMTDVIIALWADNSAISLRLFNTLKMHTANIPWANKRTRFPLVPCPATMVTANGICALNVKWNGRCMTHYFLILPDPPHNIYIGADILIRLRTHVDTINEVVWAPVTQQPPMTQINPENLISGQTIPEVCTLISEQETVIPAYTKGVAVRLNLKCGQALSHSLGFYQPSPKSEELGLTLEATPLVEVTSRAVHILFNNCTAMDIRTILHHLSSPSDHPVTAVNLAASPALKRLHDVKPMLHVIDGILWCTAALPRVFNRNHRRSKTQPESKISLTKLNPMPEEPRAEGS